MPLQLRDKIDFIPELTINAQRLRAKSVQHPFFLLAIRWSLRSDPTLGHQSPSSNLQMADQDQALQVILIPLRSIRYYLFDSQFRFFLLPFLDRL
jgi:hypothetical protein